MLADREEPTPHLGLKHGGPINQFCRILTSSIIDLVRMRLSANPRELAGGVSVSGVENGHPCGVKNGRIWQRRQEPIYGRAERL